MSIDINDKQGIGKRIRDLRLEHHYTQAELSEALNVSVNFISELENGKKGMSVDTLSELCRYFNISADYIIFGKHQELQTMKSIEKTVNQLPLEYISVLLEYLQALYKIRNVEINTENENKF